MTGFSFPEEKCGRAFLAKAEMSSALYCGEKDTKFGAISDYCAEAAL